MEAILEAENSWTSENLRMEDLLRCPSNSSESDQKRSKADAKCSQYGYKSESAWHLFAECWFVKCIWGKLNLSEILSMNVSCISDWVWHIISSFDTRDSIRTLIRLWIIWNNRNYIVHGKSGSNIDEFVDKIKALIYQFDKKSILGLMRTEYEEKDGVEIFCDGSYGKNEEAAGYAVAAIRRGNILRCKTGALWNCKTVLNAEIAAAVEGLKMARDMRLENTTLISDSIPVLWSFQRGSVVAGEYVPCFSEGLELLMKNNRWSLRHVFREHNELADGLAMNAKKEK